jgi:hypothetical protein
MPNVTSIGRYQVGDHLPLFVQCVNSLGVPTDPTLCPTYVIYDNAGVVAGSGQVPIRDAVVLDGWFGMPLRLLASLASGMYSIVYSYQISGVNYAEIQTFEIVGGGDAAGQVISLDQYRRPEAGHLMIEREDGTILSGRNPQPLYP